MFPIANQLGIRPIHFDIVQVAAIGIGLFLPPLGIGPLVALRFAGISVTQHAKAYAPYALALLVGLMLIICFPERSPFLPPKAGFLR